VSERRLVSALGVVFLVVYALPIINPGLPRDAIDGMRAAEYAIWAVYAVEFVRSWRAAPDKHEYLAGHWVDAVAVVLPMLRPLRAALAVAALKSFTVRFARSRRQRVITNLASVAIVVWFVAGLAVTEAERGVPGATITHIGAGWWWALTTMTTTGYGDVVPVTVEGQLVAGVLMILGVAILGTVAAVTASYFYQAISEEEVEAVEEAVEDAVARERAQVEALRLEVAALRRAVDRGLRGD
jgi:voltage-gated potassium channel